MNTNSFVKHALLAVAIFALIGQTANAQSQIASPPKTVVVETTLAERTPITEIPKAVPNSDPRVTESMTINSEALHGFSNKELEKAAAMRIAMLSGAVPPGEHVSRAGYGEYRLDAGDEVEFLSFDDESLSREITVRYDGHISLPLVPDIKVAGLTRREAEDAIRAVYGKIYRDPEIALTITNPLSKTYAITGDVQDPGRYEYTRATTLTEALSLAGGLAQRTSGGGASAGFVAIAGQITKAFVIRNVDGERQVAAYDMRGLGKPGDHAGDAPIYYGDLIYVPEGVNLVYLLGESQSPVIVELTEGMTLLQMLALSGGFNTSTARLRSVVLLREVDDENSEIHLIDIRAILKNKAADIQLLPGDVVYIPRKKILRLQEFVQRFTGSLSPLLGLYSQAVNAFFTYDLSNESLKALENQNAIVSISP